MQDKRQLRATWRAWWRTRFGGTATRPLLRSPLLGPERLEDRCLLTGGALDWMEVGPSPQTNPLVNGGVSTGEATSGRVTSLAFGKFDDVRALYLGSASGGAWVSTNYTNPSPTWTEVTATTQT